MTATDRPLYHQPGSMYVSVALRPLDRHPFRLRQQPVPVLARADRGREASRLKGGEKRECNVQTTGFRLPRLPDNGGKRWRPRGESGVGHNPCTTVQTRPPQEAGPVGLPSSNLAPTTTNDSEDLLNVNVEEARGRGGEKGLVTTGRGVIEWRCPSPAGVENW